MRLRVWWVSLSKSLVFGYCKKYMYIHIYIYILLYDMHWVSLFFYLNWTRTYTDLSYLNAELQIAFLRVLFFSVSIWYLKVKRGEGRRRCLIVPTRDKICKMQFVPTWCQIQTSSELYVATFFFLIRWWLKYVLVNSNGRVLTCPIKYLVK